MTQQHIGQSPCDNIYTTTYAKRNINHQIDHFLMIWNVEEWRLTFLIHKILLSLYWKSKYCTYILRVDETKNVTLGQG
jgi:hypothetical protein